jgi:hypothetical protein
MSSLIVQKDTTELLFDTNFIAYGLVKSGYMSLLAYWTRKTMPNTSLDPNWGGNWTQSTSSSNPNFGDAVYGFTVANAISPIVFITGSGCLVGSAVSGSSITFYYTNATTSTKFFCFDLMADNLPGTTSLKTWTDQGRITFNSLQPPLNVIGAITAPAPGAPTAAGGYYTVYTGGYNRQRQAGTDVPGISYMPQCESVIDIPLTAGVEYAAYLPWSRSCGINDLFSGSTRPYYRYSGSEGAYGNVGSMSFIMGATAATTMSYPNVGPGVVVPCSFDNLPIDRFPTALIITTATLLFPYN